MKVVFSEAARRGLREIGLFIGRDNKKRALSFVRELRDTARELGETPLAFPIDPRLEHLGVRRRVHRGYLIFYRIEGDQVAIIQILHGARDDEALIRNEKS